MDIDIPRGAWFNTAAQVTSITVTTVGGGSVAAVLFVYGKNNG